MNASQDEIVVGDQVELIDRMFSGETKIVLASIREIRYILGKQTYVVETENGTRRVVGASQVRKIEPVRQGGAPQ